MTKQEFFKELKFALRSAEFQDVEEIIDYYDELIMERRERGESEESVIDSFDPIEVIAANFSRELSKKEKHKKIDKASIEAVAEPSAKNFGKAVGSAFLLPIKIPLAIILSILLVAICIVTFAAVTTVWVTTGSLLIGGASYVITALAGWIGTQSFPIFLMMLAMGFGALGIGMLMIPLSKRVTRWLFKLAALIVKGIIRLFGGKPKGKKQPVEEEL